MLETQRSWPGGDQGRNSVGLGALKFLLSFCTSVCMRVAGLGWGGVQEETCVWSSRCQEFLCSLAFAGFI